jgi:hypothetical protein
MMAIVHWGDTHMVDERGRPVDIPFLPVQADFWNADHTRYTLFFDPGRVKQGILPNEQLGRPLRAGGSGGHRCPSG